MLENDHLDRIATALEALAFSVETHLERIADAIEEGCGEDNGQLHN